MGGRKQKNKFSLDWASKEAPATSNFSVSARNLRKSDLGAVIFGCTHNTINECLTKQLFGLPGPHFAYIKNIREGLALFLFNYHDRKLYGIFEAAGPGQMNIDRYAWVREGDDTGYTSYPAQVRVRVKMECLALTENQFKPIIASNYYESKHFHFELDKDQTNQLISLFESVPVISNSLRVADIPPVSSTNMSYASVVGENSTAISITASILNAIGKLFRHGTQEYLPVNLRDLRIGTSSNNNTLGAIATTLVTILGFLFTFLYPKVASRKMSNRFIVKLGCTIFAFGIAATVCILVGWLFYEGEMMSNSFFIFCFWVIVFSTLASPILLEMQIIDNFWIPLLLLLFVIGLVCFFIYKKYKKQSSDILHGLHEYGTPTFLSDSDSEHYETELVPIAVASSSQPTWTSLFKTQPASEVANNDGQTLSVATSNASVQVDDCVESVESEVANNINWDGKWDQPWESEEDLEVNTSTNNFPLNQDYKANGMEEYKWGGEWEQPWESDINTTMETEESQPGPATTTHFLQENTWEERQLVPATTTDILQENTWEESRPVPAITTDFLPENTWEDDSIPHGYEDKGNLRQGFETSGGLVGEQNWDGKWDQPWESDEDLQVNTTTNNIPFKSELLETEESESSGRSSYNNSDCNKSETNESDKEEHHVKEDSSVSTTVDEPGSQPFVDPAEVDDHVLIKSQSNFDESVYIVGGFDGSSWTSSLESYSPLKDTKSSLNSMQFVKKYASAAILNGEVYHFGGLGFGGLGSDTVQSFIPSKNQWVSRPPLFWKNTHVAGASVKDRLFVVGGANGQQCSSEVEYLDLDIGKWIPTCPMLSKRLAPAMAELKNVLYVSGGHDGVSYISSFERHDPREESWEKLPSMKTKKGCHSMVILNEKLYTLGGFDGEKYVPAVECFDTRMGSWVEAEPMNTSRGNFGAFVLEEKLYTIGGVKQNEVVMDIVECYKEGSPWEILDLKAIGKRSHFSAIVA